MDSPSSPMRQQNNHPSWDGVHRPNSASHIRQHFPSPRTSGMFAHTSWSAARLKARRSSPSSSSSPPSPSSSSSSDSLAPPAFEFKRTRRHRQRPRSPALLPQSPTPRTLGEQVNDSHGSARQIASSLSETLNLHPDQVPSLDGSTDPPITSQESQSRDTGGAKCEDIERRSDLVKKDNRKLLMWRAACAMAHAYVHQHDLHCYELHQHGLRELQQLHNGTKDKEGLCLHEDISNGRFVRSTTKAAPPPSAPAAKISVRDEMYPSSMCTSNDVVCIDEVVNPTQAAEWFGTLFLSTSALVS